MLKLLEGIKVLDLTRLLPGPLCTWYLAELGAEIIKIEPPEGDYTKLISSELFDQINFNKEIKTLDLKNKDELEIFFGMIKDVHVLVESFRPGVTQNLGIDFESLKKINPTLVYCSITGYGQTGPYRDYPGHDLNYLSYSGILEQMAPIISNFQIADISGGSLSACIGILASLLHSQKNKTSHYIDISMLDCVMSLNQVALATNQKKNKNLLTGDFPFYGVYKTSDDKYIALGALEFKFWKNFCKAVEKENWITWHQGTDWELYRKDLIDFFKSKTQQEWNASLANKDCCFSPVLNLNEALKDPHIKFRKVYWDQKFQMPIKIS